MPIQRESTLSPFPTESLLTSLLDFSKPPKEQQSDSKQPNSKLIRLPSLYPAQQQIKTEAARFNVLDIGRRAGKTYLGTHLALEAALQGQPVGWFAPNYKYLLEVWQQLTKALRPVAVKINATERRIELANGGVIECWTLDGTDDPGRSRKYKLAIIDEAAIAPNLKAAWEQAIRATLTDLQGDAWFLSTPKGLNYFYELFQRGQDAKYPDWRSWQMPSGVNPYLPVAEIAAAHADLPEMVFNQEYLAEFISGDGAVFRNVDACLIAPQTDTEKHKGHLLVAGVDWARVHDFTAISIVCCHCRSEVYLDRFNKIGWDFQRARLKHAIELWGVADALVESNSIGSPNLEAMRDILPDSVQLRGFETTYKSKAKLIQALALAFEKEQCKWLPDQAARYELIAYEATVMESGYTKYSAPEGQWDDTVIARALAWKTADSHLPIELTADQKLEAALPESMRREAVAQLPHEVRDFAEIKRDYLKAKARKEQRQERGSWNHEICDPASDPLKKLSEDRFKY